MILKVKCAYCPQMIQYTTRASDVFTLSRRSMIFDDKMKCPSCGSISVVEISTKRKSKGKKMREMEAKAAATEVAAIRVAATLNAKIGDALLAQPGCECGEMTKHRGMGTHRGEPSGHPLSTGWSRDGKTGHMLPTLPHHYYHCPLRGSEQEINVRDSARELVARGIAGDL